MVCFYEPRVLTDLGEMAFSEYARWTLNTLQKDLNLNMNEVIRMQERRLMDVCFVKPLNVLCYGYYI